MFASKKNILLTIIGVLFGVVLGFLYNIPGFSSNNYSVILCLFLFCLTKFYPTSKKMTVWLFLCVFGMSFLVIHLNTKRIEKNIQTTILKNVDEDADISHNFSVTEHGPYARVFQMAFDMRKEVEKHSDEFQVELEDCDYESALFTENLTDSNIRSKKLIGIRQAIKITRKYKNDLNKYLDSCLSSIRSTAKKDFSDNANDFLYSFESSLNISTEAINKRLNLNIEVFQLTIKVICLMDKYEGFFDIEDEVIIFTKDDDACDIYNELIDQINSRIDKIDEINEFLTNKEEKLIEKFRNL